MERSLEAQQDVKCLSASIISSHFNIGQLQSSIFQLSITVKRTLASKVLVAKFIINRLWYFANTLLFEKDTCTVLFQWS